ncbi:hypothetical protein J4434_08135 [Candidatus Woesearchaeota archaeon]|nr:hypothetical protein [Candidatus Woesearchaeota archaeon]
MAVKRSNTRNRKLEQSRSTTEPAQRAYLSIDLDYWMQHRSKDSANAFFQRVFEKIFGVEFSRAIPLKIVELHQHMLDYVNDSDADALFNVDYHADLMRSESVPLEHNWINFVNWRGRGTYVWFHPDQRSYDMEVGNDLPTSGSYNYEKPRSAFSPDHYRREDFGWREIRSVQEGLSAIDLDDIVEVGIALSPRFTVEYPVSDVMNILALYSSRQFRTNEEAHKAVQRRLFPDRVESLQRRRTAIW